MKKRNAIFLMLIISYLVLISSASALEESVVNEKEFFLFGLELDSLIVLLSSLLALILFIISFAAFKRERNARLLFVTGAFFLFVVKGFITSIDAIFPQKGWWADPIANLMDFAILLLFFLGLIKK